MSKRHGIIEQDQKKYPNLKVAMLAADEMEDADQIEQIIKQQYLEMNENWMFGEENTQKLYYEIDPHWYGEIPRTYFFDSSHQRTGISGVISEKDYDDMLKKF